MKKSAQIVWILILLILFSCSKDDDPTIYSFSGKVQKGPFITGTTVTLNELSSYMGQTGRSFTTSISNDDGSFSLNSIELDSDFALLTANGFYFSEIYGELSVANLSLQAIVDLSLESDININVLTHITKGRVENLVSGGMDFETACQQAENEFLNFLGAPDSIDAGFCNFDISNDEEEDALLLAFSVILQRFDHSITERQNSTAKITELLANLSGDFTSDGEITNQNLIDVLLDNISTQNLIEIRNNIENRYQSLGIAVTIPDFEYYISKFQEKHNPEPYTDFYYPEEAEPFPTISPGGAVPNLLYHQDSVFEAYKAYSIAAAVPLYASLRIEFICVNEGNFMIGGGADGWNFKSNYPNGFTLIAGRQNQLMGLLVHLEDPKEAVIEYYENDATTPTYTRQIKWQ